MSGCPAAPLALPVKHFTPPTPPPAPPPPPPPPPSPPPSPWWSQLDSSGTLGASAQCSTIDDAGKGRPPVIHVWDVETTTILR